MAVSEEEIGKMVGRLSERMSDPSFVQTSIGAFVESQPFVSQYLSAQVERLGGGEAVMHAAFHASALSSCMKHSAEPVSFGELNSAAASTCKVDALRANEPAMADYLTTNVEHGPTREAVALIVLAWLARPAQ